MLITRMIQAPRPSTMAMLLRRMPPDCRKDILGMKVDAVGLVQTDLPNLFYLADVGVKAGSVSVVELHGTCPQHINTIGFFGDTAAVQSAMKAVKEQTKSSER